MALFRKKKDREPPEAPKDKAQDVKGTLFGVRIPDIGPRSAPVAGDEQTALRPTRKLRGEPVLFLPEGFGCGLVSRTAGKAEVSPLPDHVWKDADREQPGFLLHMKPGVTYSFGRQRDLKPVAIGEARRRETVWLKAVTRSPSNLPSRLQFGCVRVAEGDRESVFVQHLPGGAKASSFLAFLEPGKPMPSDPMRPWHEPLLEGFAQTRELVPGTRLMLGLYVEGKPRILSGRQHTMIYQEGVVDAEGNLLEDAPFEADAAALPEGTVASLEEAAPRGVDLRAAAHAEESAVEAAGQELPHVPSILIEVSEGCRRNATLWRGPEPVEMEALPGGRGEGFRIPAEFLARRHGRYGILLGSGVEEMQERFPEFRDGEHYPDLLVLSGEPSVSGAHAWLGLREDGSLEIRTLGPGRILLQGPGEIVSSEIGYDPQVVEPGSLFVLGQNLEYRFQVDREE
jgi:hypothetical protein